MSARQKMTMRAVLQRNRAEKNPDGNPYVSDWRTIDSNLSCWVWDEPNHTRFGTPVIIEACRPMMIVPVATDITIDDRIESVTDRLGNPLYGTMRIDGVARQKTHLEVRLYNAT